MVLLAAAPTKSDSIVGAYAYLDYIKELDRRQAEQGGTRGAKRPAGRKDGATGVTKNECACSHGQARSRTPAHCGEVTRRPRIVILSTR